VAASSLHAPRRHGGPPQIHLAVIPLSFQQAKVATMNLQPMNRTLILTAIGVLLLPASYLLMRLRTTR
jgi:hypothetical protein